MNLHWPQITILILLLLGLGMDLARHGQPKTGRENFFTSVISVAFVCFLLYKGGFF